MASNVYVPNCIGHFKILFGGVFTGLSGWLNGIRDMEISQSSFHDQRKGTRACSPLIGTFKKTATKRNFFLKVHPIA
jgi:hypothetical protein